MRINYPQINKQSPLKGRESASQMTVNSLFHLLQYPMLSISNIAVFAAALSLQLSLVSSSAVVVASSSVFAIFLRLINPLAV